MRTTKTIKKRSLLATFKADIITTLSQILAQSRVPPFAPYVPQSRLECRFQDGASRFTSNFNSEA